MFVMKKELEANSLLKSSHSKSLFRWQRGRQSVKRTCGVKLTQQEQEVNSELFAFELSPPLKWLERKVTSSETTSKDAGTKRETILLFRVLPVILTQLHFWWHPSPPPLDAFPSDAKNKRKSLCKLHTSCQAFPLLIWVCRLDNILPLNNMHLLFQ